MFRFNFVGGDEGDNAGDAMPASAVPQQEEEATGCLRRSEELAAPRPPQPLVNQARKGMAFADFGVSDACSVRKAANPVVDAAAPAASSESDLIPGRYEGGYKVWECSIDLSRYIAKYADVSATFRPDAMVIELGCGQGLVGVVALALGAGEVHFQDYDKDVIWNLTIPVVEENIQVIGATPGRKARFFAGDWGTLHADVLGPQGLVNAYDVVLTTETIYNEEASKRLLSCIKSCLKPEGVCYLSAKSFYFGVGGGVAGFLSLLERDGTFRHRRLQVIDDGRSNRREILEICRR